MELKKTSRIFFALTFIAIAVMGVVGRDFAPIWRPVPDGTPLRPVLPYLCDVVALSSGVGLFWRPPQAAKAALALFGYLQIWAILFKGPFIVQAPLVEGSYQSIGENAVQIAGAWIVYVWQANQGGTPRIGFLAGPKALLTARLLYGFALIAFGFSHFVYLELTAPLVPKWLPGPGVFWAYLTGGIYIASGISVITELAGRLGAMAAALQITLITFIVWGPFVIDGNVGAGHWQETVVSWAIMAGAWVVAASYEKRHWFERTSRA